MGASEDEMINDCLAETRPGDSSNTPNKRLGSDWVSFEPASGCVHEQRGVFLGRPTFGRCNVVFAEFQILESN